MHDIHARFHFSPESFCLLYAHISVKN